MMPMLNQRLSAPPKDLELASKKNQHFVPKVHLKYFATDPLERQIDIWLHKRGKTIEGASIRDQCSKSYFYGKDLKVENFLNSPEALFGKTVNRLVALPYADQEIFHGLLFFWLLQYIRSEKRLQEQVLMLSTLREKALLGQEDNAAFQEWIGPPTDIPAAMTMALDSARLFFTTVSDLRTTLLINNTKMKFVMSDCPAVSSNKLMLMRYKKQQNWGLAGAGLYIYMPLTPKIGFFAYDRHVYELKGRKGNLCEINEKDAVCLNQLVYLHSNDLIVIPPASHKPDIIKSLTKVATSRAPTTVRANLAIEDKSYKSVGAKRFITSTDEEFAASTDGILHLQVSQPTVPNHFPKLRFRQDPKFVTTHSNSELRRYRAKLPDDF